MSNEPELPVIQRLRPHHVDGAKALIREVWRENFGAHPEAFVRDFLLLPHALDDIDQAAGETDIGGLFLVQSVQGCVVATGAIRDISDDACELSRMFVAKAWRKRGLATALANHLLDHARSRNVRAVRLMSNAQLVASHRLYHGLGFRACPSWDPQDEGRSISMRLLLQPNDGVARA